MILLDLTLPLLALSWCLLSPQIPSSTQNETSNWHLTPTEAFSIEKPGEIKILSPMPKSTHLVKPIAIHQLTDYITIRFNAKLVGEKVGAYRNLALTLKLDESNISDGFSFSNLPFFAFNGGKFQEFSCSYMFHPLKKPNPNMIYLVIRPNDGNGEIIIKDLSCDQYRLEKITQ